MNEQHPILQDGLPQVIKKILQCNYWTEYVFCKIILIKIIFSIKDTEETELYSTWVWVEWIPDQLIKRFRKPDETDLHWKLPRSSEIWKRNLWEMKSENQLNILSLLSLKKIDLLALLALILSVKRVCVEYVNAEQQYCDVHMDYIQKHLVKLT